jgi:UTP:GlnB (protein PII) uridylyltransferase
METRVRFLEGSNNALTVLEISAPHRHPLAENIEQRLRRLRVQVVHSESRMMGPKTSLTLHLSELDGGPLSQTRRLELQALMLANASPSETPPPLAATARHSRSREEHIE